MVYIRSYIKHFFSITLIALSVLLNAQEPAYKHYTVEDGLPSSETYSAFQDSKGYMWFATDAGVSRFNGYEFENFDASDGLTDNTVFFITEDHKGRIWFGTFNSQLCYYDYKDGKIYPYQYNYQLNEHIKVKATMLSFVVDSNETIWMGFHLEGIYSCNKSGEVQQIIDIPNEVDFVNKLIEVNGKIIQGGMGSDGFRKKVREGNESFPFQELTESAIRGHKKSVVLTRKYPESMEIFKMNYYDEGIFMAYDTECFHIKKDQDKSSLRNTKGFFSVKNRLFSIFIEDKFIWFCTEKAGVYKCTIENNELKIISRFLEKKSVSRVYKDKEDGYWFQTLKEGIYYVANEEIKNIKVEQRSILSMSIDTNKNQLYTSFDDGKVYKLIKNTDKISYKDIADVIVYSRAIEFNYYNNKLLVGGDLIESNVNEVCNIDNGALAFKIDSNIIYKASNFGFHIYKDYKEVYSSIQSGKIKMWCTSVLKDKNKIWVGTNNGVRIYDESKITSPFKDNEYLSSSITCMERLSEELFLIGTKSYGILVIKNDSIIDIIKKEEGLVSNLIRDIHVDNQKMVWVGTNNGLSRLIYKENNNFDIYNLTPKHGLLSGEVIDICSYRNILYVATPNVFIEFDKTKIKENTIPPNVYITNFSVNTKHKNLDSIKELSHKENFIKITYEALNYKSLGEIEYQYRMVGIDTNWTSTMTRSVQYPSLQYGEYTFEVKAKNEDGYWSEPTKISFTIQPPFWLTWWFIGLEIVIGLLIIYLIFKYREKQLIQKNESAQKIIEAEKKMVELELKALRSQMNPHFIFNTLNSIQHYIAANDFKSTNKYITQFARLIRTVLNLSEKNVITIQEEVEMLELYMTLERMRFDDEFEYKINISEEIDIDYDEIPSMLIQPYVENAIWHGLMNKKGKGKIKIEMLKEATYLCCTIEDNGIGREKAAEIRATRKIKQKSVGMSITKERLDIINNEDINVEIEDVKDTFGNETGTRVKIKIAYKNE